MDFLSEQHKKAFWAALYSKMTISERRKFRNEYRKANVHKFREWDKAYRDRRCTPEYYKKAIEWKRQYYKDNPDLLHKTNRKYYIKNKKLILEKNKKWAEKNPDKIRAIALEWYHRNKAKVAARRKELYDKKKLEAKE